jgi:hypothetical protein
VPTYDPLSNEPVSSTEFCALLARNTCAVLRPCCNATSFAFDEIKCRANAQLLCEARKQKSMESGLLYDDFQAGRCVRGTAIMMRDCRIADDDPVVDDVVEACQQVLHGTKVIGASCDAHLLNDCAPPGLGQRVTCSTVCTKVAKAKGGESCQLGRVQCEAGLVCDGGVVGARTCTAFLHPLGAACTPCPTTVAPDGTSTCANDARCGRGNYCDGTATPQPVCTALPGLGEPCDGRGCQLPFRCDTDKSGRQACVDGKALGAVCGDDNECATRLCIGVGIKLCAPPAIGDPIASESLARAEPENYLARTAAACEGIIPAGAGGLAPLLPFPTDTK